MAIIYEGQTISQIKINKDSKSFVLRKNYRLTAGEDLSYLDNYLPNYGDGWSDNNEFKVQDATCDWIAGSGGDGAYVETNYAVKSSDGENDKPDPNVNPLQWGVRSYLFAPVEVEEPMLTIWTNNSPGSNYWQKIDFRTTAGTELTATRKRSLQQVSFVYNLASFNATTLSSFNGKINMYTETIAGVTYQPGTVKLSNLSAKVQTIKNNNGTTRWEYTEISVSLIIDPETYWKKYPNVSTLAKFTNTLEQIWTVSKEDERWFGSRSKIIEKAKELYTESSSSNVEAMTEPMFLDEYGKINGMTNDPDVISGYYTQTPTYIEGCADQPVSFASLQLPMTR